MLLREGEEGEKECLEKGWIDFERAAECKKPWILAKVFKGILRATCFPQSQLIYHYHVERIHSLIPSHS